MRPLLPLKRESLFAIALGLGAGVAVWWCLSLRNLPEQSSGQPVSGKRLPDNNRQPEPSPAAFVAPNEPDKIEQIQGAVIADPDRAASITVLPQGKRDASEAVQIFTNVNTAAELAGERIKVGDLKIGYWVQVETVNGIARRIIAGHLWQEDGEKLVLFKDMPKAFFTYPDGFEVRSANTKFGPLTMMYGLTGNGSWLRFSRKAVPKEGIVMYWPADLAAKFYDGNTYGHPDEQGRMQWPGDVSEVRIWFKDEQ